MGDTLIEAISFVLVLSITRAIARRLREKKSGDTYNGCYQLPNLAPFFLILAAVFTLIMLWVYTLGAFATNKDIVIAFVIVAVTDVLLILISMPFIFWYVKPMDEELEVRNSFGRTKRYSYSLISHCIKRRDGGYAIYMRL